MNAEKMLVDISTFSPEQREEILKIVKYNIPKDQTAPKGEIKPGSPAKRRTRTRRMSKVNGYNVLTHLSDNGKHIRVSCLEDVSESLSLPVDWKLAKRGAKILTRYVKAKNELLTFRNENKG